MKRSVKPGSKSGRDAGASLLFPSQHPDEAAARQALLHVVRRTPRHFGHRQSRWQLSTILASCPWLRLTSLSGLYQLLRRLGISYQRGRDYVHSPDLHYQARLDHLEQLRLRALYAPDEYAFFYLDEMSFYQQPSLSTDYEAQGGPQSLAYRSHRSNTAARILAALNAVTGAVHYRQRTHIDTATLAAFWFDLRTAYPTANTIYVVVDNWPVHFHPDVLAPLVPQSLPFPPAIPANWPTQPQRRTTADRLPIQLVSLPTYASWLNPIKKLWRWLRQELLHLHRFADNWAGLKLAVTSFLDRFALGSTTLLRYVGLLPI